MTVIKALEELKAALESCRRTEMVEDPFDTYWITADACNALLSEIEAEIAERFMELPVDADGAPLKVGKTVYGKYLKGNTEYTVRGFSFDQERGQWDVQVGDAMWVSQNLLSVKPRTIEDVLRDVWKEALDYAKSDMWRNPDEVFSERATEIRELLGVDE
jgi:hypothetical protein